MNHLLKQSLTAAVYPACLTLWPSPDGSSRDDCEESGRVQQSTFLSATACWEEHHSLKTGFSSYSEHLWFQLQQNESLFLGHSLSVILRAPPLKQTGPITTPGLCKRSWSLCSSSHSEQGLACSLPVSLYFSPSTTPLPPDVPTLNWTPEQMLLGQGWGPGASRY